MTTQPNLNSERNRHFMLAVRRLLATGRYATAVELTAAAALEPAPQYYVTFSYALRRLRNGAPLHTSRRPTRATAMWTELSEKVNRLRQSHHLSLADALTRVLTDSPASSFFLSPSSALRLYHHLRSSILPPGDTFVRRATA